ncbi:hypothetical protein FQR65_LT01879 [Abscondita terminalis]|nr:hypothetical protein FQR65_LT01879 [Abscondita terminalis]
MIFCQVQISLNSNDILLPVDTDRTLAVLGPNPGIPDTHAAGNRGKPKYYSKKNIEKDEINKIRQAADQRKEVKVKNVKRQVFLSDSEGERENEKNLYHESDDDGDWYEKNKDEDDDHVFTDRDSLIPITKKRTRKRKVTQSGKFKSLVFLYGFEG